ncbi:hypothetical protein [Akkermansia sp.]|uniref:hypothetical protein n=1 Tax=Akkermansia sp. TaxID=1872421 RepID=UPI0025BD88DA|nr:hypothetical protein [Akkermansia sp.]MCC8148779.1 hypothetical protein [Akkermansia sp.]
MKTDSINKKTGIHGSRFFYILAAWLFCSSEIVGLPAFALGNNLSMPDTISALKQTDPECVALGKLLQKPDMKQFYDKANTMLDDIDVLREEGLETAELTRLFWVFYYVSAAPLFHIDYDENTENIFDESLDYDVKYDIQNEMEKLSRNLTDIAAKHQIKNEELASLLSQYSSAIILAFRSSYDKNLKEKHQRMSADYDKKETAWEEEYIKKGENPPLQAMADKRINFENKIIVHEIRNNKAYQMLETSLEKKWLSVLLKCYPGQTAVLKRYLNAGGYESKEIPDLLNRTVGRNKNTEFLYKGFGKKSRASLKDS